MQGTAEATATAFQQLMKLGPMFGYLPEPEKSFGICPLATKAGAKAVFEGANLPVKFCCGHWCVGNYAGSAATKDRWVEPMVDKWVRDVKALAKVAPKYPQSALFGFSQLLQAE